MNKRALAVAVGTALLGTGVAQAQPFNSFDPRSMGMGGAGVAVGDTAIAPFFNPALLSVTNGEDDFSLELPIIGARAYDPNELISSVDDFQDADLIGQIDLDIVNAEASASTDSTWYHELAADATQLANDPNVGLPAVMNKMVQGEVGVATVIGIPSKKYGAAFSASSWATFGGRAIYPPSDQTTLTNLASDVEMYADCLDTIGCNPATQGYTFVNPDGTINFDTTTSLDSAVQVRGLVLSEFGLSLAREFNLLGGPVAIGITPKYVKATTFDYTADVNDADQSDIQEDNYTNETTNFNLDLGIAKDFQNGWRGGFVIKNLIPQEYEMKQNGVIQSDTIDLTPQARAGVSYENTWFTAALDVDLTENDPVGFEEATRYIALGTELNAADWAQLRLGYRVDTVNSDRSVASVGLGLSPFGLHIDVAAAGNANELGAAFQLGFRF